VKPLLSRRFTLLPDRTGQLRRFCLRGPICAARGCRNFGNTCYLPDGEEECYCYDHMRDHGFCPGCHQFWAGIESFDVSRTGYCENCAAEFDDDDGDYWEDDGMEWDDMPHMQVLQ
jgi:hypothetical protein